MSSYTTSLTAGGSSSGVSLRPRRIAFSGALSFQHTLKTVSTLSSSRSIVPKAICARWCFDVKYGTKMEGAALLQEWVETVGSRAEPGLTRENTRIYSGSIGSPESRLELQVEFGSLEELERFWGTIPVDGHTAWSGKVAKVMIDGSPKWEVYRTIDVFYSSGLQMASSEDVDVYGMVAKTGRDIADLGSTTSSAGVSVVSNPDDVKTVLDWKGDPMEILPGDKMPFRFE